MIYYSSGSEKSILGSADLKRGLFSALDKLGARKNVIAVPPDITRLHSKAGELTTYIFQYYKDCLKDILPALGTHTQMSDAQIDEMYKGIPKSLFRVHDWRKDVITAGIVPGDYVSELTDDKIHNPWPAQINKLIFSGGHDLILSVGQVVPHEVSGMANFNKNIFVGTGGTEGINYSHFIGAVYGMERIMGKANNPVRALLNYASTNFTNHLPIVYVLTVVGLDKSGNLVTRGLFIGDDEETFRLAADLSLKVNFTLLEKPLQKIVVYLDPKEYKSTWLGNKSIYRTRMALADKGELIILAPGLKEFGEDPEIDRLIRKYGYNGTPATLNAVSNNEELRQNLSAAAHLIHGSTEGRFSVTYCPGHLTRAEIESVNYKFADLGIMMDRYNPGNRKDGFHKLADGEEFYLISQPAIGLWSVKKNLL
jgi:nickel-dependent lactate racemase